MPPSRFFFLSWISALYFANSWAGASDSILQLRHIWLQQSPEIKAAADSNAALIKELGERLKKAQPCDMNEVCQLVKDLDSQLKPISSDQEAVLSHFKEYPRVRMLTNESTYVSCHLLMHSAVKQEQT